MPPLRWQVERDIFGQFGPKLAVVGVACLWDDPRAPTQPAAAHPALNRPIAQALLDLGLAPADFAAVGDPDLANLRPDLLARFADVLDLRVLELVLDRWDQCDQTKGTDNQMHEGKLYGLIQQQAEARRASLRRRYGIGSARLVPVAIRVATGEW